MGKASLFQELLNKGADGNLSDSPLVNLIIATGNFTIIAGFLINTGNFYTHKKLSMCNI